MLFRTEKESIKPQKIFANLYDAMFLSGAMLGLGSSLLFATSLDQISKAMLTTTGVAGLAAYTLNSKATERTRKLDKALSDVQWESTKHLLKEEEDLYRLEAQMIGTARKVNLVLETNPYEWNHWANQAGVVPNMPPVQELTGESVEQPTQQHRIVQTNEVVFEQEFPDLAKQLADDMKNTLIVGVPGSGKGLLVSNALQHVQNRGDTTVFYVDPKNDKKESGYFKGRVDHLYRLPGGIRKAQPVEVYNWLKKIFEKYDAFDCGNGRKLLVLDEITSLVRKLENVPAKITETIKGSAWLEEQIIVLAAAGDSEGATLWGIGQNGHNTGIGMDGGAKSQLTPIALISIKQLPASQSLLKADFVPNDHKLSSNEIKAICQQSPIGRAIFHGGLNEWYPMPVLPNPSGYDRDSRTQIEAPEVEETEQIHLEPVQSVKSVDDFLAEMVTWMQSLDELPNVLQVKKKWESLSGQTLEIDALKLIMRKLGLNE